MAHLLLYCVLPCVVLKSFCIEYSAQGAVELAVSIAAGAGVLLLSMAVSWFFFRKDPMAQIGVAFSNAGFMGFPLVTAVLGGDAVFYAAGFVALLNALQWTYGQTKLSGDKKYIQLGAVLKNPLVLPLLTIVCLLLLPAGWKKIGAVQVSNMVTDMAVMEPDSLFERCPVFPMLKPELVRCRYGNDANMIGALKLFFEQKH